MRTIDINLKNIDMDAVGMTHGAHESSILLASGAKALCHDLNELLDWIKQSLVNILLMKTAILIKKLL